MTTMFLGGSSSPLGWAVQFVHAEHVRVLGELAAWREEIGDHPEISDPLPISQALERFLPFESPWTRELLLPCGEWTAYLNNDTGGGDASASSVVVANRLNVRWVMAENTQPHDGHQSTQLWVGGPEGEGPLRYERTIAAFAEDGRWKWHESGRSLDFEDVARYRARRKRDRFDRALLLQYLGALGIRLELAEMTERAVVVQQRTAWQIERPPRKQTLDQARAELGLQA